MTDVRRTEPARRDPPNWDTDRLDRERLRAHVIPDVRDLANDLESRGEDVSDLRDAVDGLDRALASIDRLEAKEKRGRVDVPG